MDERKIIISDENNETIDIMLQSDFVTYETDNFERVDLSSIINDISPNAYGPWSSGIWRYGRKSVEYRNYAAIVSAILLITGYPAASSAVYLLADRYIDNFVTELYFKRMTQYRNDLENRIYQGRQTTVFYFDSEYSDYADTFVHTWTGDATN